MGIKLFIRLSLYINVRWHIVFVGYLCAFLSLSLLLVQPLIFSYLIDHVLVKKKIELILPLLLVSISIALISLLLNIFRSIIFRYLGIKQTLDIREKLIRHLRKIPLPEIEKNGAGKYVALFGYDAFTLANFPNTVVIEMATKIFMIVVSYSVIFYMDVGLGLFALLSIPMFLFLPFLLRKPLKKYSNHVRNHNEEVGTHLMECIEGSREIRSFGLEQWEEKRNEKLYAGLVKSSTMEALYRASSNEISTLLASIIMVTVYSMFSYRVVSGEITIGMLVASVTYLNNAMNPFRTMTNFFSEVVKTEVAMSKIEEFISIPIRSSSLLVDQQPIQDTYGLDDPLTQEIIMEGKNVHITCDGTQIVSGVDFTARAGQVIAIVGRSGSGKSTLFQSMMGYLPVSSGNIWIKGKPIDQIQQSQITSLIGAIFQNQFLFRGTIFENISFGNLSATEEEVHEAAIRANLKELINSLPNGLHTVIDHGGYQLSGGERQRVAIARIYLKNPSILILDEPTSALDREAEAIVLSTLYQLMRNKTTFIATHRLETIINADVIYVIEKGEFVEVGTHQELLSKNGLYSFLINSGNIETRPLMEV